MSPLQGAIPLVQVNEISMLVAEKLNFDMSGARNVLFQEDRGIAEGSAGLPPSLLQGVVEAIGAGGHPHAAPAPAHGCLDDHRIAQRARQRPGFSIGRCRLVAARKHRHVRFLRNAPRLQLIAELFQDLLPRTDKDDVGPLAGSCEQGVLRQKSVPWMDGLDFITQRQLHNRVDVQIGADRLARFADGIRLIRFEAM